MNDDTDQVRNRHLNLLVLTSDLFPPFRPAAKAIFGEEFTRLGHRVDWIMQAEGGSSAGGAVPFGNGTVFLAPTQSGTSRLARLKKYLLSFLNDFKVIPLVKKHRYDVVQVKDKYVAAIIGLLAARLFGAKFCFWLAYPHAEANLHGARQGIARYPLFYWFRGHYQSFLLYRVILPFADHAFVQSDKMKSDIVEKGIDPRKMTPVPGSLNLDSIPYRHEDDPGPAAAEVLYVGTLIRQRRLDFLVRMFAQVLTKVPNAKLVFVGKAEMPEDQELLDNEIDRLGIPVDRICFIGEVQMSEVWRYVESASVCLSPYYPSFELDSTSPTKLIEYMAMSRPVVANEHPEQSVVIADSGAGLCVPWDETAFAEAVVTLLGDPDKAEEMSRRGRAWVERHRTNEIMAELVEGQYRRLLGKPGDSNEARSRGLGAGQTD